MWKALSFSKVKTTRKLLNLSDAVCLIKMEKCVRGTGLLLFSTFILTNAHVIGDFDPFTRKLSKTFTAVFGYEGSEEEDSKHVAIKEHAVAVYHGMDEMNRFIDYALLELDVGNEVFQSPELLRQYTSDHAPDSGEICIVGHPDGEVKRMDFCFIIGKENQQVAAHKHISDNIRFLHIMKRKAFEEKWEFRENQITYDSCFFHGSSGSPVFDEDCHLIGIHTGGYAYEGEGGKTQSILEYAFSMKPILENIIKQVKNNKRSDILEILSKYELLNSNLNIEDNDVEMMEEP